MVIIITFKEGQEQVWHLLALEELSTDLKRILAVQLEGLIDDLEVCEDEGVSLGSVDVIRFLDGCYQAA